MDTAPLKKFAQAARRRLLADVAAKLQAVLAGESLARREAPKAIEELEKDIASLGQEQVVEKVAYTWFNRFCALRFMDASGYTAVRIVSPVAGQTQPQILAEAKTGHIDPEMVPDATMRQRINGLLAGTIASPNGQAEAYSLLVVAACNAWSRQLPFLFERIRHYAELLLPDDLLSENSLLADVREVITEDTCTDVEIIGWLYQFYIGEKKDDVFAGLKKNKKVTPENIPAATQLFTPHWIVRYLVENSLGRLWMLNRPGSKLAAAMDYYIAPQQAETDFLRISTPEDIKVCDPACGSGHMLTYAFDLLYQMYEEEGYAPSEIPEKILTKNLYGIEIDKRAGQLAAFALCMKARAKHARFFAKGVAPNICVLQNVQFADDELKRYMEAVGHNLFTAPLVKGLHQFAEADNFGSLIRPEITNVADVRKVLAAKNVSGNLLLHGTHEKVTKVLEQSEYLSPRYHVVIANPPYMGASGMNARLKSWINENYPTSKADFMTCFMERCFTLSLSFGFWGMINLPSWMFLSTFEDFRCNLLKFQTFNSFLHLGRGIFGSDFGSVAFSLQNKPPSFDSSAVYRRLFSRHVSEVRLPEKIQSLFFEKEKGLYRVNQANFAAIPGSPLAYWASEIQRRVFLQFDKLGSWTAVKQGLATADNERFLRFWHEVSNCKVGFNFDSITRTKENGPKWFPYNKGGEYRRWYGNFEYLVNWEFDGAEIRNFVDENGKVRSRAQNTEYYFNEGVTWTFVSSGSFGVRYTPQGSIFDVAGSSAFPGNKLSKGLTAFLACKVAAEFLSLVNPTLNFQVGNIASLPISKNIITNLPSALTEDLIDTSKTDWDSYETSWDFTTLPLLATHHHPLPTSLAAAYATLRAKWQALTLEMQQLEEENNRIFIEAYGLQEELTPEVPLKEITLTCNPHYRYGVSECAEGEVENAKQEELEARLLADTMREFVSYAVGCMFGRYALEKPGLILANQGETLEDYLKHIPQPSFTADDDNVIPMLDGDWFPDDVTERFCKFLRVTFGEEQYEANLKFVENALNSKGKLGYSIRDYFLNEFYADHVKRYKKRPIYWLFSSPKGSFNALIYMHRYRPDTVSVVLSNYLRPFMEKLRVEKVELERLKTSADANPHEQTRATKRLEQIQKILHELEGFERDVLFPLATQKIAIDLDDGVKANYPKFGTALKKIPGLDAGEE